MQRSARTAHTMRPSRSGSSVMQSATGQAAWQIEHANAPKQRSGSMTAIVFGAFLRGASIIFVHIRARLYLNRPLACWQRGMGSMEAGVEPEGPLGRYRSGLPIGGSPT